MNIFTLKSFLVLGDMGESPRLLLVAVEIFHPSSLNHLKSSYILVYILLLNILMHVSETTLEKPSHSKKTH